MSGDGEGGVSGGGEGGVGGGLVVGGEGSLGAGGRGSGLGLVCRESCCCLCSCFGSRGRDRKMTRCRRGCYVPKLVQSWDAVVGNAVDVGAKMLRWLLLAHGLALTTGLRVNEPADLAGEHEDSPAEFAPANYDVTALGVVATSCPCEWAVESSPFQQGSLSDRILIVNDDVCNNSCTAPVAACAAQLANASGVLITNRYNPSRLFFDGRYRDPAPEGEFAAITASTNASCQDAIPTAYVTSNFTNLLATTLLVTDAPRLQPRIGARPTLDALRTRPHPHAVPMRAIVAPHRPGAGCTPGPHPVPLGHHSHTAGTWSVGICTVQHMGRAWYTPLAVAPRRTSRSRSCKMKLPRREAISSFQPMQARG